ncbi:MAG: 50S ribosomal protein L28 [Deltaproteobacteria bacterium]|nr:50S ribosomal protein L28 [Deltaproteobacteria bacterium]
MARKCQISGVARQHGHRVSHANNKTKHVFMANIQNKRVYVPSAKRSVTLKISTRMLRTIDKLGLEGALKKHGVTLESLL